VSDVQPTYRREHPSHFGFQSQAEADAAEVASYGGYLVAESICPEDVAVIAAAPELYEAVRQRVLLNDLLTLNYFAGDSLNEPAIYEDLLADNKALRAALAKAEGRA
jgi:hypothetical protein